MIKKTVYICEKCGKEHKTKKECLKCEKSHNEEVRQAIYTPCYYYDDEHDARYHYIVSFLFEDGKRMYYKRS